MRILYTKPGTDLGQDLEGTRTKVLGKVPGWFEFYVYGRVIKTDDNNYWISIKSERKARTIKFLTNVT